MDSWRLVENLMDSDVDDNASSIYSSHDDSGWDSSTPFELHDRVLVEPLVQPRSVNCADDDIFQEIIEFDDQDSMSRRLEEAQKEIEKLRKALAKARRDKLKLRSKLFLRNKQLKKYRRLIKKKKRVKSKSVRDKTEASSSNSSEPAASSTIINVYINPTPPVEHLNTNSEPIAGSSKDVRVLDGADPEDGKSPCDDMKIKTSGSIYPRECCGSQYVDKHAYYRHKRKVHDKKTWPCDYCDTKLSTSHNLKRHMKTAH